MEQALIHDFLSPMGQVRALLDLEGRLSELHLMRESAQEPGVPAERFQADPRFDPGRQVEEQLREYLEGSRMRFDLELNPRGTAFQLEVWKRMLEIPYGRTLSYAELARDIGRPGAVRAVGRSCGQNPIWVVIPCHRVIGASGSLTGYAGGLEVKERLLELEWRYSGRPSRAWGPTTGWLF